MVCLLLLARQTRNIEGKRDIGNASVIVEILSMSGENIYLDEIALEEEPSLVVAVRFLLEN